ncbi:MAG: hypothetical protein P8J32_05515 [bacterium]|nr:hypothetical protein [bacterium]
MKEEESNFKDIQDLFNGVLNGKTAKGGPTESEQLSALEKKAKASFEDYDSRIVPGHSGNYKYPQATYSKRIKENDYVRMYGEGSGPFVTLYASKHKRKWVRNLSNKFKTWKAERKGINYIFHKNKDKESIQELVAIRKQAPKKEFKTPYQITSLENMFKDLAKERETLKQTNKTMLDDLNKLKKKRLKKRITYYIPRIKFRAKK